MDERWYVEAKSDFVAAGSELIMMCMAMASVRDGMATADLRGLIAIKGPPQFRPITLDLDSGDEEFFMDGDRDKDLNSPDSNDSGIQADAPSFRHLSDDLDLYAVVKKPKRKGVSNTMDDNREPSSTATATSLPLGNNLNKDNGSSAVEEQKPEDPYAEVDYALPDKEEVEEEDDDYEDATYAVVNKKTRVLRIIEQDDDLDNHDDNGNHFRTNYNYSNDENDVPDKLRDSSDLPEGWEQHEDEEGLYFWHIRSGVTQREPPSSHLQTLPAVSNTNSKVNQLSSVGSKVNGKPSETHRLPTDANVKLKACKAPVFASDVKAPSASQFLVHCLGSVLLAEEELADDRSGPTINQCIVNLSRHPSGTFESCKLQGRDLYLEFVEDQLVLTDVHTGSVVSSEPVKSVRVWGVGREKVSRDFAYVVRDPVSERHVCWVFKCERTGHEVASALRSVCYKILKENEKLSQKMTSNTSPGGNRRVYESQVSAEWQKNQARNWNENVVFPVPMSESKKIINCQYLGMMKVPKPLGMDVLNDAIEMIYAGVPSSKWVPVSVEVAPSAVTIYDRGSANSVIFECRIRFLTFLGICINNCKLCAFIMNSAQNEFFAHVFHCIPDAGVFCRTIKAACKLRYQKCLDAQAQKERDRGNTFHQASARNAPPLQGFKESLQKGVSNLFRGSKKQQQKG